MAKDFWKQNTDDDMTRTKHQEIANEAERQEESCLYTSTIYYMWLRRIRFHRAVFVVAPIVLGYLATFSVLENAAPTWVVATLAMLAGLFPAIATALKIETNVETVSTQAAGFKALQDRFRQLKNIDTFGTEADARERLHSLMEQLDELRKTSLTAPEKYFVRARTKIESGDYSFTSDDEVCPEKIRDQ